MGKRSLVGGLGSIVLVMVLVGGGVTAGATETNQAAVVVRLDDGFVVTRVVSFDTPTITGIDLLQGSGLPVVDQNGSLICQIGPTGCDYPDEPCFCSTHFWSYWAWDGDSWEFSPIGAAVRQVEDGQVDGWAWSDGTVQLEAIDPVALFDPTRMAPGYPELTVGDEAVVIQVDVAGDADGDGLARLAWRRSEGAWNDAVEMARVGKTLRGTLPELAGGSYEMRIQFVDADGINGSSSWQSRFDIAGEWLVWLPLVYGSGSQE